jgi:hypothetical protein
MKSLNPSTPIEQDTPRGARDRRPGIILRTLDGGTSVPTKIKSVAALRAWARDRGFTILERGGALFLVSGRVVFEIVEPRP